MSELQRVHVYYSGRVQGVGFRYRADSIAHDAGITGWVKNLHDGRVEVCAEGPRDLLQDLLQRINGEFSRYLRDVEIDWQPATGEFADFSVVF